MMGSLEVEVERREEGTWKVHCYPICTQQRSSQVQEERILSMFAVFLQELSRFVADLGERV
jgi:hypothetical protein